MHNGVVLGGGEHVADGSVFHQRTCQGNGRRDSPAAVIAEVEHHLVDSLCFHGIQPVHQQFVVVVTVIPLIPGKEVVYKIANLLIVDGIHTVFVDRIFCIVAVHLNSNISAVLKVVGRCGRIKPPVGHREIFCSRAPEQGFVVLGCDVLPVYFGDEPASVDSFCVGIGTGHRVKHQSVIVGLSLVSPYEGVFKADLIGAYPVQIFQQLHVIFLYPGETIAFRVRGGVVLIENGIEEVSRIQRIVRIFGKFVVP